MTDVVQRPVSELRFSAQWELELNPDAEHPGLIVDDGRGDETTIEDGDPNDPRAL